MGAFKKVKRYVIYILAFDYYEIEKKKLYISEIPQFKNGIKYLGAYTTYNWDGIRKYLKEETALNRIKVLKKRKPNIMYSHIVGYFVEEIEMLVN